MDGTVLSVTQEGLPNYEGEMSIETSDGAYLYATTEFTQDFNISIMGLTKISTNGEGCLTSPHLDLVSC